MKINPRASLTGVLAVLCAAGSACDHVASHMQPAAGDVALAAPMDPVPTEPVPMEQAPMAMPMGEGVFYVEGQNATRPRVRYTDGQVSLNESCAIQLGNKLNRKIPPVYVNGSPVGFC